MTSGNPLSETLPWLSCCWCINYPFWHPGRKSSYVYTTIYGYRSKLGTPINASKKTLPVIHVDTISRLKSVVPPGLFAPYPMTCPRYDLGGGHMNTRAPVLFLRNCWPAHHFHQNRGPCLFFFSLPEQIRWISTIPFGFLLPKQFQPPHQNNERHPSHWLSC